MRREGQTNLSTGFFSDSRKAVQINGGYNRGRAAQSGSHSSSTNLSVRWRPSGRASLNMGPFFSRSVNDLQWVQRILTDTDHYVFGRIDQETVGLTGRFDFTFTPNMTLQFYAQPFVSAGTYSDFKEVSDARAGQYEDRIRRLSPTLEDDRYRQDLDGNGSVESFRNPDFNVQQFRSTLVLRWEYKPGSLLYLVWSQGRDNRTGNGNLAFRDNLDELFQRDGENVFMLKVSYWITP